MKKKNKKNLLLATIISVVLILIIVAIALLQYASAREADIADDIEKYCKSVFALKYSNEDAYEGAMQNLKAAKHLYNTHHFRDKSVQLLLERADSHIEGLTEEPLLNYDANELRDMVSDKLKDAAGNWSVYFEIPGTSVQFGINNRTVTAASTIKLFNMITLYNEINDKNISMTNELAAQVRAMITESSNVASNAVTTAIGTGSFAVGAQKVTALARSLGAKSTKEEHMLFDVKTVTPGQNTTSVADCATVLRKLYFGECVSPAYDSEMLELLKQQTRNFKIPLFLPEGTVVAHKTGENSTAELDVGIIYSPNFDYILCISVTDFGTADVRTTFGEISKMIYTYLN